MGLLRNRRLKLPNVLITGGDGFIGKNLRSFLKEIDGVNVVTLGKNDYCGALPSTLNDIDVVFHLAGINRASEEEEFYRGNVRTTESLEIALRDLRKITSRAITVVYASSILAERNDPYGRSKRAAEEIFFRLQSEGIVDAHVFRLPNVFGKWSKPNYNSVVATFCHNIARDLPICVHDKEKQLALLYIDDLMVMFLDVIKGKTNFGKSNVPSVINGTYQISVGELANRLLCFHKDRKNLRIHAVANGFDRALYATYISFLQTTDFAYSLKAHSDERGVFSEILKSTEFGQISFFSLNPGFKRGDHYHHSKTEKFLVIKGCARFRFRNVITTEVFDIEVSSENLKVIESIPGWSHYIENTGKDDVIAVLWANEIFDPKRPDTYRYCIS